MSTLGLPLPQAAILFQSTAQQDKIHRELFVGNTPPGTPELLLLHYLNAAMRRVGLCQPHETPIMNARVNQKFSFIELISADMATRAIQLNGIPFLGNVLLKVSRPSKYAGPLIPSRTWQEYTGQSIPDAASMDAEQEKIRRELFIGNTTPEMTEAMLKDFLGNALQQVGLTTQPGNPITACRVSGKFAFCELRSVQETTNALNLNNIPFLGTALRVGRPSKYTGAHDMHGNWEDILAKYMSGELQLPGTHTTTTTEVTTTAPATRVVQLVHMLTLQDLENDDEYNDILEDTREECASFGQLVSVVIPRKDQPGATKVFLEYASTTDAQKAINNLRGRTFDGRQVQATFLDETTFASGSYT